MKRKRYLGILGALLYCLTSGTTLFADSDQTGCATFHLLGLPFGARGAAMGGAFCGLADDMTAIWWNPAGLGQISRIQAHLCHQEWFQGFRDEYGAIGIPGYSGMFGTGLLYSSASGIEGYDRDNMPKGDVKTSEAIFSVAYARLFRKKVSLGMSVAGLFQNLDPGVSGLLGDRGQTVAANLGILWKTRRLGIGASLQNVGPDMAYSNGLSEPLPQNLKAGISFLPTENFTGVFDVDFPMFGGVVYHFGGEYWLFNKMLPLRAGYTAEVLSGESSSVIGTISMGAGFGLKLRDVGGSKYSYGIGDLSLDYCCAGYGVLGITHRIDLAWTFGRHGMEKTGGIIARVVDLKTGSPLEAIVRVSGTIGDTVVTSPSNGKARFLRVPPGAVRINVRKDFYTEKTDTVMVKPYETLEVTFTLQYTGPKDVPPDKLVREGICGRVLVGKITEEGTVEPLEDGILTYEGPDSGTVFTDTDGWYKIPDIRTGNYTITVESQKHDYFPAIIADVEVEHEKATLLHCNLKKVKTFRLYFETDRAYVHPSEHTTLDTLASFMRRYAENLFEIHGHTDPRAPTRFRDNLELSYARAMSVKDYLVRKDVAEERLTVKGCGDKEPIAPNDSEENMSLNRRIEIIIK
jgi:outer membrane protein OmpA-like peptidoglycan-associated protein